MAEASETSRPLPYDADRILFDTSLVPKDPESRRIKRPLQPGYRPQGELGVEWSSLIKAVIAIRDPGRWNFQYSPLKPGEIRLVIIRPGKFDDQLQLDIRAAPLTDKLAYKALSYEWGFGPAMFEIILRDYTSVPSNILERVRTKFFRGIGTKYYVRQNLVEALRHLRDREKPIVMWIDALCINQTDKDEKAEQIAQMANVYGFATNVDVWLGTATQNTDNAMDFVGEVLSDEAVRHVTESRVNWADLMNLMSSRWFSRRWVIQEVAMAKKVTVHCGLKKIPWSDFSDAVTIFKDREDVVEAQQNNQVRPQKALTTIGFNVLAAMGATKLINAKSQAIERHNDDQFEMKLTLEKLVCNLTSFDAGDPRDIIYAVLPISRDFPEQLRPNYNHSLLQVYTEFVQYCITSTKSLDILCRHWTPTHTLIRQPDKSLFETTLPSWMSILNRAAFGPPDQIFRGRRNAESLVNIDARPYNASRGHSNTDVKFGTKRMDHDTADPNLLIETYDGTLTVNGIILGPISNLTSRIIPGKLPQELITMAGWTHSLKDTKPKLEDVPDMLWRTLMADRDNQDKSSESIYRRACLRCLLDEDVNGDIDVQALMSSADARESLRVKLPEFLKRTQEVVWNRKAFRAGKENFFGLGPKEAQLGDLLCILYGCSVPVILREVAKKPMLGQRRVEIDGSIYAMAPTTSGSRGGRIGGRGGRKRAAVSRSINGRTAKKQRLETPPAQQRTPHEDHPGPFYEIIGECFVHGIMDGEALDSKSLAYTDKQFTLV
ncbi:hypothetical protein VTL71DRAFT_5433 [Oculimacula yallundae]|uniref:Heterokaryon incompatibility domain-containing protein n=1 Tax=Oculimacula yallundae TaxID=86028 RepID=A0ABR4C120_9HELO